MPLLSSILGFSLFGLGARIGQLGIQKRNLLESTFLSSSPSSIQSPIRSARVADFLSFSHMARIEFSIENFFL